MCECVSVCVDMFLCLIVCNLGTSTIRRPRTELNRWATENKLDRHRCYNQMVRCCCCCCY